MLYFFNVHYSILSDKKSKELFSLRKDTFKNRLNWAVNCHCNMEFDEYDNHNTSYLLGVHDNSIICSSRFIEMKHPNMITGTFFSYFNQINIPEGNYIESSRFFVDKARAKSTNCNRYPISLMLFLAMINYSKEYCYDGIFTIVSAPMIKILRRSGWRISIAEQGLSEKKEKIYLVHLPIDDENRDILISRINENNSITNKELNKWPLIF